MGTIYYTTEEEARNSKEFKNKNFSRLLRDNTKKIGEEKSILLEINDFGTHLTHQTLIELNQ